jgi:transposase
VSVAMQAIFEGMAEPTDLRCTVHDGHTVVMVGSQAVAGYDNRDTGMRNIAVVTLTELGFSGRRVAEVVGLTPEYVSMLRGRARREGSAGLVRVRGRRPKLSAVQVRRARAWRVEGLSDAEIARRLGVSDKTAARVLAEPDATSATPAQPELELTPEPEVQPEAAGVLARPAALGEGMAGPGAGGGSRIAAGRFASRYAGAMLLHAFTDLVDAGDVFASAAAPLPGHRFDDVALLAGVSTVFALGFASLEQAKHPDRAQVGPVVGIDVLPELRTLRPRLAAIADGSDPLALQRAFATAMLAAEACTSGVYFIDEHFVPYTGALPVGKGWNTKRRHAEAGRVDTMVCDAAGRAVCFTAGEPSGLSVSLPATLAELKQITGADAKIMLGFDRGGAYASVFTVSRAEGVDWVTYRRGKLATPAGLPVHATLTRASNPITVVYTDETVTIKDYGQCRQITLFEAGTPVLQILTSDTTACAGALIWFIRARWRIENLFKYLDFYGIDYLADYTATIEANTRPIANPARVAARNQLKALQAQRDELRTIIGAVHTDRDLSIAALNRESLTAQKKIHTVEKAITAAEDALKTIPAKLPANQIDPDAKRAIHRAHRRGLQMVLRLLAANAEHWLAHHLNAYLQDPHEYRAITRNLLHMGGTITYHNSTIHIELDRPATPRLTRALTLLLDEINTVPPHLPGDPRPLTYTIRA